MSSTVLAREYHGKRLYRLSSYYWARTTGEMPVQMLFPLVYTTICFFMMGFYDGEDSWKIFSLLGILYVTQFGAQGLGYLIGSMTVSSEYVITLLVVVMVPSMSLCPMFLGPGVSLPAGLAWTPYISIFRWAAEALSIWCWSGVQLIDWNPSPKDQVFFGPHCCRCTTTSSEAACDIFIPGHSVPVGNRSVQQSHAGQVLNGGKAYIVIDGAKDVLLPLGIDIGNQPNRIWFCLAMLVVFGVVCRTISFTRFYFRYRHMDSLRSICSCCCKRKVE